MRNAHSKQCHAVMVTNITKLSHNN